MLRSVPQNLVQFKLEINLGTASGGGGQLLPVHPGSGTKFRSDKSDEDLYEDDVAHPKLGYYTLTS